MTTPAITITNLTYTTSDGDQTIEPNETVTLTLTVTNHLDPATNVSFTLTEDSPHATVTSGNANLASLSTLESAQLATMTVAIGAAPPLNHGVRCTLTISSASPVYADNAGFTLTVLPIVATHAANNITTSVTSVGRLGFGASAGGTGEDGVGFKYKDSVNYLYEGALIMGIGADSLSNAARTAGTPDEDFVSLSAPNIRANVGSYAEYGIASFDDAAATNPLPVSVLQESWQMASAPDDDYVAIVFTITNDGSNTLTPFHVGWYLDWDVDGAAYTTNRTGYDPTRGLGYVWDDGTGPEDYIGIMVLTPPGTTTYRGIWNDGAAPGNPSWGTYDDYTDQEKWETIAGGIVFTDAGPADVAQGIGTGPFEIFPGDSILVAFAILAGDDLVDLQANADAAQAAWNSPTGVTGAQALGRTVLSHGFPNPFSPSTQIAFELPRTSMVDLRVFSVTGQLVRTLESGPLDQGVHLARWDGRDESGRSLPSGTYFFNLSVDGAMLTRKVQLLR